MADVKSLHEHTTAEACSPVCQVWRMLARAYQTRDAPATPDDPEQLQRRLDLLAGKDPDDGGGYIRRTYRVPAYMGGRVVADGRPGVIAGFEQGRLVLNLDDEGLRLSFWHPRWRMDYVGAGR
jgi:hypothetical protein